MPARTKDVERSVLTFRTGVASVAPIRRAQRRAERSAALLKTPASPTRLFETSLSLRAVNELAYRPARWVAH
jgi:hypothetical protein